MKNKDENMHKGAPVSSFLKAKDLRERMTTAESKLWEEVKGNKFHGLKFRRQHPVQLYIVDFYCHQLKLVIELDGGYHFTDEQQKSDTERTKVLEEIGLQVLRFTNEEVLNEIDKVLMKIKTWIDENPFALP